MQSRKSVLLSPQELHFHDMKVFHARATTPTTSGRRLNGTRKKLTIWTAGQIFQPVISTSTYSLLSLASIFAAVSPCQDRLCYWLIEHLHIWGCYRYVVDNSEKWNVACCVVFIVTCERPMIEMRTTLNKGAKASWSRETFAKVAATAFGTRKGVTARSKVRYHPRITGA